MSEANGLAVLLGELLRDLKNCDPIASPQKWDGIVANIQAIRDGNDASSTALRVTFGHADMYETDEEKGFDDLLKEPCCRCKHRINGEDEFPCSICRHAFYHA